MEEQDRTNDTSPPSDRPPRFEFNERRNGAGATTFWRRCRRWWGAVWDRPTLFAMGGHTCGAAAVVFCLVAGAPSASAQQTFWTNNSLGDWFISTNWSPVIPTATHDAAFGRSSAGSGALISTPGAVAQNVFVGVAVTGTGGGGNGTLTLAAPGGGGPPGNLTVGNRLVIGQSNATIVGNGTLNISGGGDVFSNSVEVALNSNGPFGTINIADPGSNLNTGRLTLGNDTGHGVLNIQNGGVVNCQNEGLIAGSPFIAGGSAATGAATVSGVGSTWVVNAGFVVGYNANGSLTVSNGGQMQSLEASVATLPGSVGTVTVTGANSRWVAIPSTNIFVSGWSGSTTSGGAGTINILDGGQVVAALLKVFSTGFVRVDNGSTSVPGLLAQGVPPAHTMGGTLGDISIGHIGTGRMEVRQGGAVRTNRGFIGFNSGTDGAVLVTGAGGSSLWQCTGSIWVGNGGNGTLEVRDGASTTSAGNGYIAFNNGTTGYALVSGTNSVWSTAAGLYIGGNSSGPGGNGGLQIENSATAYAGAATLYNTGTLLLGADPHLDAPLTALGGSIQMLSTTTFTNAFTLGAGGVHVQTNFFDATFSGVISGSGALDKSGGFTVGPGSLSLSGNNSYTGGTTISAGSLFANNTAGSATGTGPVTVTTITGNTVLGGTGTITGPVTVNANSILLGGNGSAVGGSLTIGNNLTLNPGAKIQLLLAGAGTHSSLRRTAGTWSFPANLAFRFTALGAAEPGPYDNIITGLASNPGNVGTWTIETPGYAGTFSYDGAGNIDLTLTAAPPAASCGWFNGASYPIPILDSGAVTLGNMLYSFGGVSNSNWTANAYRFDGSNWTSIAPLPEGNESPAVATDGTFIYIISGNASPGVLQNTVYRYDPVGNTYSTLAPCNVAATASSAVYLNGKIYKLGGLIDLGSNAPTNAVEVYDIASNSWSQAAPYPLPLALVSVFVRGGFIYGAGGINFQTYVNTAKAYRYDPNTNSWTDGAMADLPALRSSAVTLPDADGVVLAGGEVGGTTLDKISASVLRWTAATNTWSSLPDMLQRRARGIGAVLSGSLSVIGGRPPTGSYFVGSTDNQRFACAPVIFTVTTVDDHNDGVCNAADCTLREAITSANARIGSDTIVFAPGVTGTIELTSALPNLSDVVTLAGPGANLLTVRRNSGPDYRILTLGVGASAVISGITIADGRASGSFPANCGGGIYADHSALSLINVELRGNAATLHGGAIFNSQSTVAIANTTIDSNSATASGGAIFNFGVGGSAGLSLTNATINQNTAAQYGGAIYNDGTGGGNAAVTLLNCTFNQNSATLIAGGIYNDALNPGSSGTAILHLANTILRAGASGANLVNDGGTLLSDGHNLSSDNAAGYLTAAGDLPVTDPQLDPLGLANNGGLTRTVALLMGSPAINAGDDLRATESDQRGFARSGASDIGAYEFDGAGPTPTPPPTVSVSGTIVYCSNPSLNPVSGATMTLTGNSAGSTVSDGSGNYAFTNLPVGGSYTITPSKAALAPGSAGINTIDVLACQRHFLNVVPLPAGCRLAAADVNGDATVNTIDVVATQRFFLGLPTGISNVGKYKFTPANRSYSGVTNDQTAQDYDALIFGDVATGFVH